MTPQNRNCMKRPQRAFPIFVKNQHITLFARGKILPKIAKIAKIAKTANNS